MNDKPEIELRCLKCGALLDYDVAIDDGKIIYLIDECVHCAQDEIEDDE